MTPLEYYAAFGAAWACLTAVKLTKMMKAVMKEGPPDTTGMTPARAKGMTEAVAETRKRIADAPFSGKATGALVAIICTVIVLRSGVIWIYDMPKTLIKAYRRDRK
ncbi:hypothetical protein [Pseudomonas sp.]|uniref:hypothetical protein n=1 Tax=Pseudomonas sp. TaxID=306 RepID=UPI003FD7DFB7